MAEKLTISQLNKLGERLRKDPDNKDALRLLEIFRLFFTPAYDRVFGQLRELRLDPAGRPAKSTQSIIAKLVRLRTRVSRMQDIAGCRVEVENMPQQDRVVDQLHAVLQRIMKLQKRRFNQMIFLVDYDRKKGELRSFKRFRDDQRAEAQRERLDIELGLNGSRGSREVVLLEAHNEQVLHRTHQRYFKTTQEILESMSAMVSAIPK